MNKLIALAGVFAIGCASPAFSTELIVNGGFETGDYTRWTTSVEIGSGGDLIISTPGLPTPISASATAPNPAGGNYYSVTDQSGGGAYSLTQTFVVPTDMQSLMLTFQMFVNNQAFATSINDAGLTHYASPNQHARVDVLIAGADPFSTAAGDIVANLFIGADAISGVNPYTSYAFDLSNLVTAGSTYQIRFAEADNQFYFQQGVDNVSLSALTGAVPEPSTWAMMLIGFGAIGLSTRRRRKLVGVPQVG